MQFAHNPGNASGNLGRLIWTWTIQMPAGVVHPVS